MKVDEWKQQQVIFIFRLTCSCRIPASPMCPVGCQENPAPNRWICTSGWWRSWVAGKSPWSCAVPRKSGSWAQYHPRNRPWCRRTQWFWALSVCRRIQETRTLSRKRSARAFGENPSPPVNSTTDYGCNISTNYFIIWMNTWISRMIILLIYIDSNFSKSFKYLTFFHNDESLETLLNRWSTSLMLR